MRHIWVVRYLQLWLLLHENNLNFRGSVKQRDAIKVREQNPQLSNSKDWNREERAVRLMETICFTLTLIFDHFVQLESNNMCRDVAVWPMHSSGWTNSSPRVTVVPQHLKPVLQFSATTEHDWPLPAWNNQLIWASFVYPLFNGPTSMTGESFYPKCPSWHKVLL